MSFENKSRLLKCDILRKVYYHSSLSINVLSKLTFKSVPVVAQAVAELVESGELIESGVAPSTGGRRPAVFLYNPEKRSYIVSVGMDVYGTRLAIYDQCRKCVYGVYSISINLFEDDQWFQKLVSFIKLHIKDAGMMHSEILGLGWSMPGFVNSQTGINESYPVDGSIYLKKRLEENLGIKVYLGNDSRLIALAELRLGVGRECEEFLTVNLGWGTGLGMVIKGHLYQGYSSYAGEFSHIPLSSNGTLCSCGKRGCLETETALLSMVSRTKHAIANGGSSSWMKLGEEGMNNEGARFFAAVRQGDPLVVSVLSDAAYVMGKGIATLIHIMNPQKIILGGNGSRVGHVYLPAIQQALNVYSIPRIAEKTKLQVSEIGPDGDLIGAACLVIDNTDFSKAVHNF